MSVCNQGLSDNTGFWWRGWRVVPVLTGWLSRFIQQGATGQVSGHGVFIVCWLRKPFFLMSNWSKGWEFFMLDSALMFVPGGRSRQDRQGAEQRWVPRENCGMIQGTAQRALLRPQTEEQCKAAGHCCSLFARPNDKQKVRCVVLLPSLFTFYWNPSSSHHLRSLLWKKKCFESD